MSYIELIVVLGIFAALSSVALYNYGNFQAKVDIKNLASEIALKVVEAQKSSLSGKLPPPTPQYPIIATWKPSYGIYVNPTSDNKSFIYFTDLDNTTPPQNGLFDGSACTGECLEKITITKGNYISGLNVFYQGGTTAPLSDLTVTFKRPNSAAVIKSTTILILPVSYIEMTIFSPKSTTGNTAKIKLYSSGRVQVN